MIEQAKNKIYKVGNRSFAIIIKKFPNGLYGYNVHPIVDTGATADIDYDIGKYDTMQDAQAAAEAAANNHCKEK
ncbi:MAG: hypothetical protein A3A86_08025 [Elusimicrobia bacterium RIFCSPLOWO2_01_FULL_60_11]|nr:MAG: hypothetical protein A3A86_08025 [Elusimicrobia bacterium RIFCSPLOWO2_01_FULL_60_11]